MSAPHRRSFEDRPAVRERVPLLGSLVGPSSSGKTFSALRLATGMQRITGGEIFVVDTESRRALHYADRFTFRHVPFEAPFSPLDYLAAIEYCVERKAGVVVVDSMSHEHEGPGGVLEMHEEELERLAGNDRGKREAMSFLAWAKPKAQRRRLINSILQLGVNAIFCFRAKEKIEPPKRGDRDRSMKELGWMPIAGSEFMYEFTFQCLLPPASQGVPLWTPERVGEAAIVKAPTQFRDLFAEWKPLDEDLGQALALWAAGDAAAPSEEDLAQLLDVLAAAPSVEALAAIAKEHGRKGWTPDQRARVKGAIDARRAELVPAQGELGDE